MDASLRQLIVSTYQAYVKRAPIRQELKDALKTHERMPKFLDNLHREFSAPGLNVKRETIIQAVEGFTQMFIQGVHLKGEERLLSPLEQLRRKQAQQRVNEMRLLADILDEEGESNEKVIRGKKGDTSKTVARFKP